MNKQWLTLGTSVLLKGGTQPLMIVGRYQLDKQGDLFDYSAVLNPQGYEAADELYLFNESQIGEILFEAPETPYEKEYIDKLTDFIKSKEQ